MLINKVKAAQLEYRKNQQRIAAGVLTYIIGQYDQIRHQDASDEKLIGLMNKFVKDAECTMVEDISVFERDKLTVEICVVKQFLPKSVDEDTITLIVNQHADKPIGFVMGQVKAYAQANGLLFNGADVKKIFDAK